MLATNSLSGMGEKLTMRKYLKRILCAAGILLITPMSSILMAEDQEKDKKLPHLEETVNVTATRSEIGIDMVSTPVTVIDHETIATSNVTNVLDLLDEYVPGLSISRSAAFGGQVSLRGLSSNDRKAPLFIDGDRFRGLSALEYFHLDPARIERIEIIRGPAATMYGTDALGGLINVITRKAEGESDKGFALKPRLRSLEYSTSGSLRSGSMEVQGVGKKFDMLFGASAKKAENYQSPEGEIPESDIKSLSFDLRLGYKLAKGQRLDLFVNYLDIMNSAVAGGAGVAPGYPYKTRRLKPQVEKMAKLQYEGDGNFLGFKHVEANIYARYFVTDLFIDSRPKVDPFSSVTRAVVFNNGPLVLGGKAFGVRSWKGNNTLTTGADWFRSSQNAMMQDTSKYDAQGNQTMPTTRSVGNPAELQYNVGFFTYNDWNPIDRWTLSAGGRFDYIYSRADMPSTYKGNGESSDFPLTGSLGVIYRPISIIHFTANVSTSFRAPMPSEKFSTMLGGYEPNPDLKPEKSKNYEIGARLRLPRLNSNLTLFQSDYDGLIVRKMVASTVYPGTQAQKNLNVGNARIKGVEMDATWMINSNWRALTNVSYLHGSDTANSKPLSYIAPVNGLVGVRYTPNNQAFYIEANERWSNRKERIDISNERKTAAYGVLNLNAGFDLNKLSSSLSGLELRLSFNNILDKSYVSGVTPENISYDHSITNPLLEPGRRLSISLQSRF
jgi:hemoglobin/transferrin/lactoferrin receptor protein